MTEQEEDKQRQETPEEVVQNLIKYSIMTQEYTQRFLQNYAGEEAEVLYIEQAKSAFRNADDTPTQMRIATICSQFGQNANSERIYKAGQKMINAVEQKRAGGE